VVRGPQFEKRCITQMYPRIPCEPVADPLGSAEHTLGTADIDLDPCLKIRDFTVGSEDPRFVDFELHHCLQAAPHLSKMYFICDQFCQLIFEVNCS